MDAFTLVAKLVLNRDEFDSSLSGVEKDLDSDSRLSGFKNIGARIGRIAAQAANAAFNAVAEFGRSAIETGMDFDAMMSQVQGSTQMAYEDFEKVRKRASELGLEAFYYLSEKGKKELFILCENIRSDGGKRFISMRNTVKGQNFVYSEADLPKKQAECLYFVFIGDEAAAEAMEAYVKSQGGLSSERFHERLSGCVYLEVFSAEGGKGKAAERLANTLFADRITAFGDNHNDLSLREAADEFYVPEGAVREAKEAADLHISAAVLNAKEQTYEDPGLLDSLGETAYDPDDREAESAEAIVDTEE